MADSPFSSFLPINRFSLSCLVTTPFSFALPKCLVECPFSPPWTCRVFSWLELEKKEEKALAAFELLRWNTITAATNPEHTPLPLRFSVLFSFPPCFCFGARYQNFNSAFSIIDLSTAHLESPKILGITCMFFVTQWSLLMDKFRRASSRFWVIQWQNSVKMLKVSSPPYHQQMDHLLSGSAILPWYEYITLPCLCIFIPAYAVLCINHAKLMLAQPGSHPQQRFLRSTASLQATTTLLSLLISITRCIDYTILRIRYLVLIAWVNVEISSNIWFWEVFSAACAQTTVSCGHQPSWHQPRENKRNAGAHQQNQ